MSDSHTPRVTVFLITYNRPHYLRESIEAVLAQTFTDFELIVYDNGSTDNTENVIKSYSDRRIRYIRNPVNSTRTSKWVETFMNVTRGDYSLATCDDDKMKPTYLQRVVDVFDSDPRMMVVSCDVSVIDETSNETIPALIGLEKDMVFEKRQFIEERLSRGAEFRMLLPAIAVRTSFVSAENLFYDDESGAAADIIFPMKVNTRDVRMCFLQDPLFHYRMHGGQDHISRFFEIGLLALVCETRLLESSGLQASIPQLRRRRLSYLCESLIDHLARKSINRSLMEQYLQQMREVGLDERELSLLLRLKLWVSRRWPLLYRVLRILWSLIRRQLKRAGTRGA